MQLKGNEANSRAETTITIACIPVYTWGRISLAHTSSSHRETNQGSHTKKKSEINTEVHPKFSGSHPKPKTTITSERKPAPSKLLPQPHGPCPKPWGGSDSHQSWKNSNLHLAPTTPSPVLLPTRVVAASTSWGRRDSCLLQFQFSAQSYWAQKDYIGMFPYKDMPSRPSKVTKSPNFIEIKLK